jgi:hypothetical protein
MTSDNSNMVQRSGLPPPTPSTRRQLVTTLPPTPTTNTWPWPRKTTLFNNTPVPLVCLSGWLRTVCCSPIHSLETDIVRARPLVSSLATNRQAQQYVGNAIANAAEDKETQRYVANAAYNGVANGASYASDWAQDNSYLFTGNTSSPQ